MAEEHSGPVATVADSAVGAALRPLWRAGQLVRITHGLLKGSAGLVIERRSGARLLLSVDLDGRVIGLELPIDDVAVL